MNKRSRITLWVTLVTVIVLLSLTMGTLLVGAQSQPQKSAATSVVPTQVFPLSTIPITKVIYIWTAVDGATQYQLQVNQNGVYKVNGVYGATICDTGTCSVKPAVLLPNGLYIWRVRAIIGGVYQPFSAWQSFEVKVPIVTQGFYSPFTTDAANWVILKGYWGLEGTNYFATNGIAGWASTISHTGEYATLTYQVRMLREGCAGCANVIAIRGNPTLDAAGWWKSEYTFDYTNNGLFSVWRDYNGTYTPLKNWTYTTAISQGGWNTLLVTANGSQLNFYINGVWVWSGSDSAYPSGAVGIGMYNSVASSGNKLWVDWAQLDTYAHASLKGAPEPGLEVGGGDRNMSPEDR